ncbi:hypothetical protein CspeluHIS016_0500240 [Cutaneotrichosporon spelunceum]|uniref:Uncharacterized protein n=1 Tax=Cutaneotrichosporon spelunceum TaxID=1672016 RepID=A0AAD3TW59_9TREE|nr:hypothetical protein CspeluHIS016_0500240 [Cutaneotrichosporon spelunceum]
MLLHKLLVALFSVPFVAAQEAAPSDTAAPADGAAPPAESPATDTAAAPAATTTHKGAVGGNTENTGHGVTNSSGESWSLTNFSVPNTEVYWVNEAQNTAIWEPYQQEVNLIIFNSNKTLLSDNTTIATNIPAGTGTWTGMISGFNPGNNYILVLALSNEVERKIGQTRGFWIKRNGTLAAPLPSAAAGATLSGGVDASGGAVPTAPSASAPASAESTTSTGGAGKVAGSFAAVVGAGALAYSLF